MKIYVAAPSKWLDEVVRANLSNLITGIDVRTYSRGAPSRSDIIFIVLDNSKHKYKGVQKEAGFKIVTNKANFQGVVPLVDRLYHMVVARVKRKPFVYRTYNDYTLTPFNNQFNSFVDGNLFGCRFVCQSFNKKKCPLGKEHLTSEYGDSAVCPTNFRGNSRDPSWVFVGEAPGRNGCGKLGLPFYNEKSGNYLNTALFAFGLSPIDIYVTNTIRCCPEDNNLKEHYRLADRLRLECVRRLKGEVEKFMKRGAKCVAVGRVAYITLLAVGFKERDIHRLDHPSYFMHNNLGVSAYIKYFRDRLKKINKNNRAS